MSSKKKTTATKEEDKPALVPKLRFPEFREAEGWQEMPIGEKVDLLSGYPFDGPDITQDSSGIRLLRGINITEGRIRHSPEIDRYYTGAIDGLEKFRVQVNDLVIGMDGSKVGKNSALVTNEDEDAFLIQRVARLRASNATMMKFIFQQINSTTFHTYVDKINTSSGIPHISAQQIKDFAIGFPSPAEQQKIAECLSSVDELMAAQSRKVDALKTHKKGIMQQLFPREGETQPRRRFPEFQTAGEWEEDQLGSVCELYQPVTLSSSELSMTGEYLVYGANGVIGSHNEYNHQESEIAVTCRGATCGEVTITKPKSWVTGNAMIVKPRTNKLRKDFIFHYFKNHGLKAIISGSAQPQITRTGFAPLVVFFPKPDEQQRIADCLTTLDALITAETHKLEALKTHKKGLMQQLFPSPEGEA